MLIERFLEDKSEEIASMAYAVQAVILDTHPAITEAWKWNTLCFMYGKKVVAYFSLKQKKFNVGFWNKSYLSSSLVQKELKQIAYYLVEELTEELLADIAISAEETVQAQSATQ